MSDLLEVLFDQMRDQRPPVSFAPPDVVRRRGRQRAHLQALSVGAAVLAVAGVGVCLSWLVDLDPAPSPGGIATSGAGSATPGHTASATVERTDVSPADMLQPSDLGVGTWTPLSSEGVFKGAERWYWADLHKGYRAADYPSRGHQLAQRVVRYEGDRRATVEEIVERYEGAWATRNIADIRAVVERSGATPYARPGAGAPLRHEIVDTVVAGDESLLIEQKPWSFNGSTVIPQSDRQLIAVVRVGDLVATVIPQMGAKPEAAQSLAVAAAARLR